MFFFKVGVILPLCIQKKSMQKVSTLKGWLTLVFVLVIVNINAIAESAPPPPPVQAVVIQPNPIPMSICNGDTITFVAGDPNANLTTYQWNFNGAAAGPQTLFGKSVFFTAGTAGAFTFDLIVSDGIKLIYVLLINI